MNSNPVLYPYIEILCQYKFYSQKLFSQSIDRNRMIEK